MSTFNTYNCNKCNYSISGYSKMKPLRKRSFIDVLLKRKCKIEYEYNEDYHEAPCPNCKKGTLYIDQKATLFFHDKEEPVVVLGSQKLPLFKVKKIPYKCTNCWYRVQPHRSLYRNMRGVLSTTPVLRYIFNRDEEPLFAIDSNFQGLECPMCKIGTFVEYIKSHQEIEEDKAKMQRTHLEMVARTTKNEGSRKPIQKKTITLPLDNDTTRKNQARDLVHHLENIGQIPKTDPEELEKHLAEKFPLAKD